MECPELAAEARAAIEARHLSELLSQQVPAGTLRLVCSNDRVTGTWEENGAVLESRFLSRNAGEDAVELLHWLASVLLEMRRERVASATEPSDPPVATAAPALVAAGTTTNAAVADPGHSNVQAEPTTSPTAAPASAPQSSERAPNQDSPASTDASAATLSLDASWVYAHFDTQVPGATGPRLGFRYRLLGQFHVGVLLDAKVALTPGGDATQGFGLVDVAVGVSASYEPLPFISASVAPVLVVSSFTAPAGTSAPTSAVVAGGVLLLARGKVPLRPVHPFLELGVQAAAPPRQATLAGSPVLTVPAWQAQVALGVEIPL